MRASAAACDWSVCLWTAHTAWDPSASIGRRWRDTKRSGPAANDVSPGETRLRLPTPPTVSPGALDLVARAAADDRCRVGAQILAPVIVDRVVVCAHEGPNRGADGSWMIGERLARQHRGELHHASAALRRSVLALAQLDRLVRNGGHVGPFFRVADGRVVSVASARTRHPDPDSPTRSGRGFAAVRLPQLGV